MFLLPAITCTAAVLFAVAKQPVKTLNYYGCVLLVLNGSFLGVATPRHTHPGADETNESFGASIVRIGLVVTAAVAPGMATSS